jgi:hypothetical protein
MAVSEHFVPSSLQPIEYDPLGTATLEFVPPGQKSVKALHSIAELSEDPIGQ